MSFILCEEAGRCGDDEIGKRKLVSKHASDRSAGELAASAADRTGAGQATARHSPPNQIVGG